MVASLRGSVGKGTKMMIQALGAVGSVGFHHVSARSRLARVLRLMHCLFI